MIDASTDLLQPQLMENSALIFAELCQRDSQIDTLELTIMFLKAEDSAAFQPHNYSNLFYAFTFVVTHLGNSFFDYGGRIFEYISNIVLYLNSMKPLKHHEEEVILLVKIITFATTVLLLPMDDDEGQRVLLEFLHFNVSTFCSLLKLIETHQYAGDEIHSTVIAFVTVFANSFPHYSQRSFVLKTLHNCSLSNEPFIREKAMNL
jgi:hypothetical protein